jgi:glycosyltransferase involved in cell wall biosynthesis
VALIGFDRSAFDPQFRDHAIRGIGRYVSELCNSFAGDEGIQYFDHRIARSVAIVDKLIDSSPIARRTARQQLLYPLRLGQLPFKMLHFPAHMDAPAWCPKPYVLTVLDLIPLVLKDLYAAEKGGLRFKFARWLEIQAIRNATLLLAISEHTKKDIINVLGIPADRIVVTPLGIDDSFFRPGALSRADILGKLGVDSKRQTIVYVGGIDPRKNWPGMLEVMAILKQRALAAGRTPPQLVLAGKISKDLQFPKMIQRSEELGLGDSVFPVGFVDDKDLINLLGVSDLFMFPSLYEGFGLPPLEAMAAGAPVVSSNRSCMPEVLGEAGIQADPMNFKEFADAAWSVLSDSNIAARLRAAGPLQARKFSWSRTGELTRAGYKMALERLI